MSQSLGDTLFGLAMVENPRFAVGIVVISAIVSERLGDISTSGLDGHVTISGYPSTSHLFVDTLFEFGVV